VEQNADVTVGCLEVPLSEASALRASCMSTPTTSSARCRKAEGPAADAGTADVALASMGVYVFDTTFLFDQLRRDAAIRIPAMISARTSSPIIVRHGSASRIISPAPACASSGQAASYWRDVGTLDAYWPANMRPHRHRAAARPLRPQLADLDLRGDSPPAKFVHDQDGRAGRRSSLVSAAASSREQGRGSRCCSPTVHMRSYSHVENAVVLPDVESAAARLKQRHHRSRRPHSGRAGRGEDPESTPSGFAARTAASA
jgi:glucose-1-phosphate adenylyltransferase